MPSFPKLKKQINLLPIPLVNPWHVNSLTLTYLLWVERKNSRNYHHPIVSPWVFWTRHILAHLRSPLHILAQFRSHAAWVTSRDRAVPFRPSPRYPRARSAPSCARLDWLDQFAPSFLLSAPQDVARLWVQGARHCRPPRSSTSLLVGAFFIIFQFYNLVFGEHSCAKSNSMKSHLGSRTAEVCTDPSHHETGGGGRCGRGRISPSFSSRSRHWRLSFSSERNAEDTRSCTLVFCLSYIQLYGCIYRLQQADAVAVNKFACRYT